MRLLVFVTDDGKPAGTGPIVFLPESPQAVLPPHPRSLPWRYFATIGDNDALLGDERNLILDAIEKTGHYIALRIIRGLT